MNKCVLRNGKIIESYGDPFFVAEMNSSHNGKIENAMKMIDEAARIGCDAVKFQSWSADSLYSQSYYKDNPIAYRMVSRFSLKPNDLKVLSAYAREQGVCFSSTPYSKDEVDFLVQECGAEFIKVASMDINNESLLSYIAKQGIATILSTGMAEMDEIRNAVKIFEENYNSNLCILHCVSDYPVAEEKVNLNNMDCIARTFSEYVYGYSDHTQSEYAAMVAVSKGAALIEKHFTLDNSKIGWDNQMATEPEAFANMIAMCKRVYRINGSYDRQVSKSEQEQRKKMRRSIVASCDIEKGDVITEQHLDAKRPGTGIDPTEWRKLVGKRANRNINLDEMICWDYVD